MTAKQWLLDLFERAASTLVQVAIVYVLAATAVDEEFWRGLIVALVGAGANVLKVAFTAWMPVVANWWADMMLRTFWTFVITMASSLASVEWFDIIDISFWKQVAAAAGAAALAIVKAVLARRIPATLTPASLAQNPPGEPPPPQA